MKTETSDRKAELLTLESGVTCVVGFGGTLELLETLAVLDPDLEAVSLKEAAPHAA